MANIILRIHLWYLLSLPLFLKLLFSFSTPFFLDMLFVSHQFHGILDFLLVW